MMEICLKDGIRHLSCRCDGQSMARREEVAVRTLKRTDVGEELREVALFSEASRSELAQIRGLLMQMPIAAGTVLMHEGAVGSEFMILADGTAEVRQGGRLLATIGAGDVVGEMALLQSAGQGYRNATVTAVTPLTVYVGTPREFRQILAVAPSVAEKVRRTATTRGLQAA
jgi:CRP-like cAMP-binding protein